MPRRSRGERAASYRPGRRTISTTAQVLVPRLAGRIEDLETRFHRAYWDSQVAAAPANDSARAELELAVRRAKGDPRDLAAVEAALTDGVTDPLLHRQLEVLRLSLAGNQMDEQQRMRIVELSSAVESDFASLRPEVDGRRVSDNEIEEILRTSDDANKRQRAWEASKEIGRVVADRVRELAHLRNAAARGMGFSDFYRMSLALQEIDEPWLSSLLDEIERFTDEPFRRWKSSVDAGLRRRFATQELFPWHYEDPFFQNMPAPAGEQLRDLFEESPAPELARRTFASWGLDISGVLAASDLYPREGKCQHAFCLNVDRSGADVRILANVVPGYRWLEIMLHEAGHAAYDMAIDPKLPYLLRRAAHTFVTEAIAILSQRLTRDARWLTTIAGAQKSEALHLEMDLRRDSAAQGLLFARWALVMIHFERDLYSAPDSDLDTRWWEHVARFQLLTPPPGRRAPDWAAKIHVAVAPVYYQNYLLGELLASQLVATCERECGGVAGNREAGRLLTERIFRRGSRLRWDELIEKVTGEDLGAAHFAAEVEAEGA